MSHMVIYRGTDGKPAYHEVEDIHDAVQYVEQLRNDQGVEHATIHRMEQVSFEYRPYFRVELRSASGELLSGGPAPAAVTAAPAAVPAAAPPAQASPVAQEAPAQEAVTAPVVVETVAAAETGSAGTEPSVAGTDADNGVGARRGLFGR